MLKQKRIRLGKENYLNVYKGKSPFDTFHGQFVLTTEISVVKTKDGVEKLNNPYYILVDPKHIRGNYNYIEWSGKYDVELEYAYKKALNIMLNDIDKGFDYANILIYKGSCYMLDKKFKNKDNWFFKSIEKSIMQRKYAMGAHKASKANNRAYGYKACIKQSRILGIKQTTKFLFEEFHYNDLRSI